MGTMLHAPRHERSTALTVNACTFCGPFFIMRPKTGFTVVLFLLLVLQHVCIYIFFFFSLFWYICLRVHIHHCTRNGHLDDFEAAASYWYFIDVVHMVASFSYNLLVFYLCYRFSPPPLPPTPPAQPDDRNITPTCSTLTSAPADTVPSSNEKESASSRSLSTPAARM